MKKQWKWFVYILECKNVTYYTGITWRIDLRYAQHLSGLGSEYTRKHGIKRLAHIEEFDNLESARKRELQIKGWNQEKKRKLIDGAWNKDW